ncbi:hypothetical protein PRZ48_005452 [Zasmidium cellare]|uniref:Sexual development protein n=1 Tax=Zasmidium cellare TaxID=395010 RepID=A0ABR0ETL2_ZASCE|nr:hypothetical protein PRZ48_005452 [Zasmidium cellare]
MHPVLLPLSFLCTTAVVAPFSDNLSRWIRHGIGAGDAGQIPFEFPLPNGFPTIQVPSQSLLDIEKQAHGTLPNGALPTSLADASATTFQAIAFGELFEVAYFTSLINNITASVPGYEFTNDKARSTVFDALLAIQAQEELHAIGVNAILSSAKRTPVEPYIPSALPFLTRSAGPFAYSYINQNFIVPGTCKPPIDVPIFRPLHVGGKCFEPRDHDIQFSFTKDGSGEDIDNLSMIFISQQNLPVVRGLGNVTVEGDEVRFVVGLPFQEGLMNGLTIVAVTKTAGPFGTVDESVG